MHPRVFAIQQSLKDEMSFSLKREGSTKAPSDLSEDAVFSKRRDSVGPAHEGIV